MQPAARHVAIPCRCKRVVARTALLAVVAGGALWVFLGVNPPWRVRVNVANLPVGTHYASLVADSGGTIRNMEWSPQSELMVPFTVHPAACIWSAHDPDRPEVDWPAYVRWQSGERYGVVTRHTDGTWRVTWFGAEAVPVRGQRWLLGRGEAAFDLAAGRTVPLAAERVRALGLDEVAGPD